MDLLTFVLFLVGFVFLIVGADWLVRGASALAVTIGISPLVVGLTVVAFGTSSPELAVGVQAAIRLNTVGDVAGIDVAMGNVLGSNIANILLILGIGAIITPLPVKRKLLQFDVVVMICASLLLFYMALDGRIYQIDGVILCCGIVLYTGWSIYQSRRQGKQMQEKAVLEEVFGGSERSLSSIGKNVGLMVVGLAMLTLGSDWLVDGASEIARLLNVSELIIGLTVVAVGTSLPEVATTVIACMRKEVDVAVGNAVGSNIFNISLVLGGTSLISREGVPVSDQALMFDFPVMIGVALLCVPVFYTGWVVMRREGGLFLIFYAIYVMALVLWQTGSSFFGFAGPAMLIFVVAAVCFIVFQAIYSAWKGNKSPRQLKSGP